MNVGTCPAELYGIKILTVRPVQRDYSPDRSIVKVTYQVGRVQITD